MKKTGELHPLETPQEPWQEININIIRLLPRLNNKDIIVVIMGQFIKMIRFRATTTVVLSEKIAKIYSVDI